MSAAREARWGRATVVLLAGWLGAIIAGAWLAFQ